MLAFDMSSRCLLASALTRLQAIKTLPLEHQVTGPNVVPKVESASDFEDAMQQVCAVTFVAQFNSENGTTLVLCICQDYNNGVPCDSPLDMAYQGSSACIDLCPPVFGQAGALCRVRVG